MRLRTLALASVWCALVMPIGRAHAAGAWLSSGPIVPVEQRVAVASGPDRTTLWTSLRFTGPAAKIGVVLPVPPGTALDFSSDAWLESLDAATAPRVLPPEDLIEQCWYEQQGVCELVGALDHVASLEPAGVDVLADLPAVRAWADGAGLTLSPDIDSALGTLTGGRFVVVRYDAPEGGGLTRTLRAVMPGAVASLPLSLTAAADQPLQVTAFLIGGGRGGLVGAFPVSIPETDLFWNTFTSSSNYVKVRDDWLAAPDSTIVESTGHEAWSTQQISINEVVVDPVTDTFFARAAAYSTSELDPAACSGRTDAAFWSLQPVAASCPRAELGVVDGASNCVEAPGEGTTDPSDLRCGSEADDIAVALSGLIPGGTWLTRQTLFIVPGATGNTYPISFDPGSKVSPWVSTPGPSGGDCGSDSGWGGFGGSGGSSSSSSDSGGFGGSGGDSSADTGHHSGCNSSDTADGCAAAAEGCGAVAEGLGDIGDIDCAIARVPAPRLSALALALAAILAPLRRRGTARRRRERA